MWQGSGWHFDGGSRGFVSWVGNSSQAGKGHANLYHHSLASCCIAASPVAELRSHRSYYADDSVFQQLRKESESCLAKWKAGSRDRAFGVQAFGLL